MILNIYNSYYLIELNTLEMEFYKNRYPKISKRLEEIYYPNDPVPLYLDKKSESLKIIQQLRNEAHRFGITHHRNKRSKSALTNELEQISGIGKQTVVSLLRHFKSVKRVSFANKEELSNVIGTNRGSIVFEYFKSKEV